MQVFYIFRETLVQSVILLLSLLVLYTNATISHDLQSHKPLFLRLLLSYQWYSLPSAPTFFLSLPLLSTPLSLAYSQKSNFAPLSLVFLSSCGVFQLFSGAATSSFAVELDKVHCPSFFVVVYSECNGKYSRNNYNLDLAQKDHLFLFTNGLKCISLCENSTTDHTYKHAYIETLEKISNH